MSLGARRLAGRVALATLALAWALHVRAEGPADLVLRGAAIYTLDASRSWARALAVRAGRIAYVGSERGVSAWIGPSTRVLDLPGRLVLPAFQDGHVHPVSAGIELGQCPLAGLETAEAILARVRRCAVEQPGEGWLVGGGWELPAFADGAPTRQALDAVAGARPVFLEAADGHSAWLNTLGLERAGLKRTTPEPAGGRIEREPDGTPAGTLREAAVDLARAVLPPVGLEERVAGLLRAQTVLHGFGITALREANATRALLETYREARRRGLLRLRVSVSLASDPQRGAEQVAELVALRDEFDAEGLRVNAVKLFADGVIEARTAGMLAPYADRPGERGTYFWDDARLRAVTSGLARAGFDLHVHAIGDGAVRQTLDAFERVRSEAPDARLGIAHLQVVDPRDWPRFRELGVFAVFQPLWAFADRYVTELTWPALGPERSRFMYPLASLARAGARLAFGSDWSVSSPDPLLGVQVAVTRRAFDGRPGDVMQPEERLDLPTALAAATIGAAAANGFESDSGSLEVGKRADLIVLSHDLFARDAEQIGQARVLLTLFEGQAVWEADARAPAR